MKTVPFLGLTSSGCKIKQILDTQSKNESKHALMHYWNCSAMETQIGQKQISAMESNNFLL